ncbi:MAG: RsmB/NOP family class I SAM-dependent RNA methyltransferase [Candidatus Kerfeldbacteria bacterium]|nr:RsmB/NOP family class I SAM-dependent RNA methyltransferase [Candidatus Kerfeldbacteria bacterium]
MNERFEQFYAEHFGTAWPQMRAALLKHHLPMLRFASTHKEKVRELFAQHHFSFETLPWYAHAALWPKELPFGETVPGITEGLLYAMNASSLIPPLVLSRALSDLIQKGVDVKILDACAAPGGKTLVLAEEMPNAHITANELSADRLGRLRATLNQYHYEDIRTQKSQAETLFKKFPDHYDGILLDAPCSSEAHVMASEKHLSEWSPNRVKQMQFRQLALLGGLLLALKPGGVLLYSTCSLAPEENEIVVAKFLNKRGEHIELLNAHDYFNATGSNGLPIVSHEIASKLIRIFPDKDHLDPMFVAVFRKKITVQEESTRVGRAGMETLEDDL